MGSKGASADWQDASGGSSSQQEQDVSAIGDRSESPRLAPFFTPAATPTLLHFDAPLLTVADLAERLSVCTATVYGWVERHEIEHLRIGSLIRFEPDDVRRFVRRRARQLEKRKGPKRPS